MADVTRVDRKTSGYGKDMIKVGAEVHAKLRFHEITWTVEYDLPGGHPFPSVGDMVRVTVELVTTIEDGIMEIPWPENGVMPEQLGD